MRNTLLLVSVAIALFSCNLSKPQELPRFSIRLADSLTIFNTANIPKNIPVMLVQFSADCKECQMETEEILANIDSFKHVKLYFITYEKFDRLRVFYKHFKFQEYENIVIGQDYDGFMPKHFNTRATPLVAVYNKDQELKAIIEGKTEISQLIQIVNEKSN